jgi:hypothetical protein
VPIACGESTFQRTMIDRPGSASTWQWKRCVDVAIVEGNAAAGRPLLFALYAANSNYPKSTIGPTELRCYKLEPDGATSLYAQIDLPADGPGGIDAVGTALESDPGDPNNVYVALGTAWLWKATIGAGTLTPSQVPTPPAISLCSLATCTDGETMTDIDLVRVPAAGPVVYASLEYGRVLEYRLASSVVKERAVQCDDPDPDAFLDRIAAVTASNTSVLIAVAALNAPTRWTQSRAPFLPDGLWTDICINTGIGNVDPVPASSCLDIKFLWSNATGAAAPLQLPLERVLYEEHWGGLFLTHQSGLDFRLYASSGKGATSVFGISD